MPIWLLGIQHRDQPGERRRLADEQTCAAPVDGVEMGVDLGEARSGFGSRAPPEGGQADEPAAGQALDQPGIQPVPGRYQHRQEGTAERIREQRAATLQFAKNGRGVTAAELDRFALGCGVIGVGEAVLQTVALGLAAMRAWVFASSHIGTTASASGRSRHSASSSSRIRAG